MRALVVYESMFGNTRRIAEAIADGMRDGGDVSITDVVDAPTSLPADLDMLVVGGPTHVFSMSRDSTRREAADRGGSSTDVPLGIREWLLSLVAPAQPPLFAGFDTRVDMPLLPGAASRSATRHAKKLGFPVVEPASFLVKGYEGPLVDGELERARDWGHGLSERLAG